MPFLKALNLFKSFSFAVFFGASFLITIVLAFYYNYTGVFLEKKHGVTDVSSTMAIGQIAEMVILPFLPLFLVRFGMKWVLALGMLCWGIRYLCFSQAPADSLGFGLVLFGIALHGICFDFFFAAGFIHVDKEAPPEIRGSAQALFTFLTYGLGMWLGSEFSGRVSEYTTTSVGDVKTMDWTTFWLVPAIGVLTGSLHLRAILPQPNEVNLLVGRAGLRGPTRLRVMRKQVLSGRADLATTYGITPAKP